VPFYPHQNSLKGRADTPACDETAAVGSGYFPTAHGAWKHPDIDMPVQSQQSPEVKTGAPSSPSFLVCHSNQSKGVRYGPAKQVDTDTGIYEIFVPILWNQQISL
jgi:hypothetical protein